MTEAMSVIDEISIYTQYLLYVLAIYGHHQELKY
jgi:hypothetical protein